MKNDTQIQNEVTAAMHWDPSVTETDIKVSVHDGVVTLNGSVPCFAEKGAAERATQRVVGVRAIIEAMAVNPSGLHARVDAEIAQAVVIALQSHVWVPTTVAALIESGWVTLSGNAKWGFQRDAAEAAVRCLAGVQGVTNRIAIETQVEPHAVRSAIEAALQRNAELDAKDIKVAANGGRVTLSGTVRSFDEREEARSAAWSTPGVTEVQNDIGVRS